jgi:hypothetical protein
MVQRRLEEYQDLGDRVERKLLEMRGELAELGDRGGPAGATVGSVCAKSYDMA